MGARARLPEREQARVRHVAPEQHVGVGRVLELDVQRVAERAARARGAERRAEHRLPGRLLRRELAAARRGHRQASPLHSTTSCACLFQI